ncbi:MAG: coenzyme F420-0:L-glutamate ligase [Firmicutes bacterium]|nr:coenzyme F420-0:L-glutamate ligase [Bacillota bacterium]
MRYTGVCARGIVTPIFKSGDDLVTMICDSLCQASEQEGFSLGDGDIVAVTEAVVARTQNNYASFAQIAADLRGKFGGESLGAVFPIMSRNRFAVLPGIAKSAKKVYIQLSYPADEVGNALVSQSTLDRLKVNPYADSFDEAGFRAVFGYDTIHPFTGVDYIEFYKSVSDNIEIVFSNDPRHILKYTSNVLCCDVHSRRRTKALLREAGANVLGLDEILTASVDGSGYNPDYGLLGSNKAAEGSVKLFPRDCDLFVRKLQEALKARTGRHFEVLVYGDGGFKDPLGGIWELIDPVISPAYTPGLDGTPNELKLKFLADGELAGLSGAELSRAMRERIRTKDKNLVGQMVSEGTTPRKLPDLLGSLSDLVSGSGDRGTPVVLIQNYFTNYASE